MILIDILVVLLVVLGAFSGHKKGLVGILVGFAALILSIVLAFMFQSVVADAIYDTGLGQSVAGIAKNNMQDMMKNGENVDKSIYGKVLSNAVTDDNLTVASENISRFVMKGLSFIAIFLIVRIICYILQMILNVVFNLPILSTVNGIGGTVVGGLSVLIKIWIVLALISFVSPLPMFDSIVSYIDKTFLVKLLYNNNLLVAVVKAGLRLK
ncbi:MAG: CvpA family protein [Clostridia bacterium]|nr:CvpA family protein [Clostridia bacterium]